MATMTMTSKRQVTLPKETCETLGLKPGDTLELQSQMLAGKQVWVLHRKSRPARGWVGCLASKAKPVANHAIEAVRASIAAGRKGAE